MVPPPTPVSPSAGACVSQRAPVIDLHCHTAGMGFGDSGCFLSPVMERNWRYRVFLKAFGVSRRELAAEGDRVVCRKLSEGVMRSCQVDAAVVLAFDGVVDDAGSIDRARTHLYLPNEFVARMAREHPGLLFGASVNPGRRDALDALDAVASEGAVLLKWLPPVQHIHPSARQHVRFYEKLAELGLPLLVHTGTEHAFPGADQALGSLANVRLPLEVGVQVIAAHAGVTMGRRWSRCAADLAALMGEFPNLWADLSSLTQVNRLGALGPLLANPAIRPRLVYGTDMPLFKHGDRRSCLLFLEAATGSDLRAARDGQSVGSGRGVETRPGGRRKHVHRRCSHPSQAGKKPG